MKEKKEAATAGHSGPTPDGVGHKVEAKNQDILQCLVAAAGQTRETFKTAPRRANLYAT